MPPPGPIADGFVDELILTVPQAIIEQFAGELLLAGLMVPWLGYFPRAEGHFIRRPNPGSPSQRSVPPDHSILIYVISGHGWVEDGHGTRSSVGPGEFILIPNRLPHSYGANPANPWSIYWLHLTGEQVPTYFSMLDAEHRIAVVRTGLSQQIESLFQSLLQNRREGYRKMDMRISSAIAALILVTIAKLRQEPSANHSVHPNAVEEATRFMQANTHRDLSLREIARACSTSVTHLTRLFKPATGFTPMGYFTHLRMMRVCQLLDTTEDKIVIIANTIGFKDPYTLSRTFKRVTGISPSDYRNRRQV